jgi:hypothetical protein
MKKENVKTGMGEIPEYWRNFQIVQEVKKAIWEDPVRGEGKKVREKKYQASIAESLTDKRLGQHLKNETEGFHKRYKCEMALLTAQYNPNNMPSCIGAWEDIGRMEKDILDVLAEEEDVLYVVSTIEMHSGRTKKKTEKKGKKKGEKKEEKKKEGEKKIEMDEETTYSKEKMNVKTVEDIVGVFMYYEYPRKGGDKIEYKPATSWWEVRGRIVEYLEVTAGGQNAIVDQYITILKENPQTEIPKELYEMMMTTMNKLGVSKPTGISLKRYPHIHIAIGLTTKTGIIRDIRGTVGPKLHQYVPDLDIKKRGWESFRERKKGREVDLSEDWKILRYVMKNSRHEDTAKRLGRPTTTMVNFRNIEEVTKFYSYLYADTDLIITGDTRPREKPREVLKEIVITAPVIEKEPEKEKTGQTNLPKEVTEKRVAKTNLEKMLEMVETYLERNQMAITPRGTIYQRIAESKKSWRYWGTPGELYRKLTNKDTVGLLSKTKKDYEEYTSGGYEEILPYVKLNFKWIEFNDFYYYIPTSEIVKKTEEEFKNECFAYCAEIKYEQVYPELKVKPVEWLKILENSGYIREEELTEEGKLLVKGIYGLMMPKTHKSKGLALYGESNSGKSSIIEPITALYPQDVILRLTDAGGFGLARMMGRPQIVISEEHHKGRLRRDQELMLLEGNINMSVDIKHKTDETVYVEARTVFICNERDWAYKQNLLMGGQSAGSGQEIISQEVIDEAYANRLIFTEMRKIPAGKCSHEKREEMIEKEKGIIPLYTAKQQFGENAFKEMEQII